MDKKNLETKLSEEGKRLAPNVLNKVYKKLGLEFSSSKENLQIENTLKEEGKLLVKNNYQEVNEKIPHTKPLPGFIRFIKNPITISLSASFLVGVIATSVLIPTFINRSNQQANETGEGAIQLTANTVTLDLISASKSYNAKMQYVVDTDGLVETDKVIAMDDSSAYLIDKYGTAPSNRKISDEKEQFDIFTTKYLTTALNYGYIEKLDYTKSNKIIFNISYASRSGTIKEELEENILNFIQTNKVFIEYEFKETEMDIYSQYDEKDYEKISLIVDLYDLSNHLFVGNTKTLKEAFFSNDVKDWVDRFINEDIEIIQEYVDMLTVFNEYVTGKEQIDSMIDRFYHHSQILLDDIELFNHYIEIIDNRLQDVKNELLSNGSSEIKQAIQGGYYLLARYLDKKYSSHGHNMPKNEPIAKIINWDLFVDGYDVYKNQHEQRHDAFDVESFRKYLPKAYDGEEYTKTEEDLFNLYCDLYSATAYRDQAFRMIDDNFVDIVVMMIEDHIFMTDFDDDEFCHYHGGPQNDDWDHHFDEWWDDNHRDGPHHY